MSNRLKRMFPRYVKENVKNYLKRLLGFHDCAISFSTNGQDLLLSYLFFFKGTGLYIDIGAHHPTKGSNSYLLYLKGWRGINVDPSPNCMRAFEKIRPGDINLEIGVAQTEGALDYYIVPGQESMNSFSQSFLERWDVGNERMKRTSVQTLPLKTILDKHSSARETIDILMIDTEGYELEVLRSNDWKKYRPIVVMTEDLNEMGADIYQNEIVKYLSGQQYRLIAKTPSELVFLESSYELHPTGVIAKFLRS